jgi:hypothetical protein
VGNYQANELQFTQHTCYLIFAFVRIFGIYLVYNIDPVGI